MKYPELYEKMLAKVSKDPESGCWNWTGWGHYDRKYPGNRYGGISYRDPTTGKQKTNTTHRAMWIALRGEPPKGMCVCHTCDNPRCCNPKHLWLGSRKANTQDMMLKNRHHLRKKTECKRGHALSGNNLFVDSYGYRHCKACERGRHRLKEGWPESLAFSTPPLSDGIMLDLGTLQFVKQPSPRLKGRQSRSAGEGQ